MSTSSTEQQAKPTNPYKAPVSAASPFAKSYLTLAVCSGLAAATVLGGLWIWARSESSAGKESGTVVAEEKRVIISRSPAPFERMEPSTAAPVQAAPLSGGYYRTGPAAVDADSSNPFNGDTPAGTAERPAPASTVGEDPFAS